MKITARKWAGDDAASWAIFVDGRPIVSGLTRREVAYHKKKIAERFEQRSREALKEQR